VDWANDTRRTYVRANCGLIRRSTRGFPIHQLSVDCDGSREVAMHVLRTTIFYVTIGKEKENGVCFYNRCCSIAKFSLTLIIDINTLQQLKN